MADHDKDYIEKGFFVIENAVSAADLESIKSSARALIDEFDIDQHKSVFSTLHEDRDRDQYFIDSAEAVHCFLEEDALDDNGELNRSKDLAINKIGHAMHDLVPAFTEFCRLPVFSQALRHTGMSAPQLWQSMYIFKQPGIGGEVRWHQDASYLIAAEPGVVGIWVAIEDADRTNGCLWVQPGGHKSPLRDIYEVQPGSPSGVLRPLDDTPWPLEEDALPLEVPAGSIVVFSDHMPHYSAHNYSERSRQAFTLHFTEAGTTWSERNWLQRPTLPPFLLD